MTNNILDFYQDVVRTHKKEYGDKTICFCQVGSFYELYDDGTNLINIKEVGDILQIQVTRKNKSIQEVSRANPLMCGFPDYTLAKFLNIMVAQNYTIVVVSQVTPPPQPKRAITKIVSPGTHLDNLDTYDTANMMSIYVEEINESKDIVVGVSIIDVSTGVSKCAEFSSRERDFTYPLDETYRLILAYNPKEIVVSGRCASMGFRDIADKLDFGRRYVHDRLNTGTGEALTLAYQTQLLRKVFPNHGLLSPIEYLNLERYSFALTSFVILIQFVFKHSETILQRIQAPEYIFQDNNLDISYNAATQLQLGHVGHILNNCSTAVGKRYFKERFFNPVKDVNILEGAYNEIEAVMTDDACIKCSKIMDDIYDIERLFRKIQMCTLQPAEWIHITSSLSALVKAIKLINLYSPKYNIVDTIEEFEAYVQRKIDMEKAYKYNIENVDASFFCRGVYNDIDELDKNLEGYREFFDVLLAKLNKNNDGFFKLECNEKDGHYFLITAKRFKDVMTKEKSVVHKIGREDIKMSELISKPVSSSSQVVKISHVSFAAKNTEIEETKQALKSLVTKQYFMLLEEIASQFSASMQQIVKTLKELDYTCCNAKNAIKYKYSRPVIAEAEAGGEGTGSFVDIKKLRHPLVERINTSIMYTANDICLGGERGKDGLLLFGINSAGKSTLMKSVGIAVIMAQAGMYVPCELMKYALYSTIFTRIPSGDDITKGQSTFTVEILELRNILKRANKNSLVIGDELCSGTESISAMSIVSAGIVELCKRNVSFIFASHLHDLVNIKHVLDLKNLRIMHLEVRYDEESKKLIYDRVLKPGPGNTLYGLEVCRALDLDPQFLMMANEIRHNIIGTDANIMSYKKSRYNAAKHIDTCAICNKKSTDVHHINEQYRSDNKGFIEYFHKNSLFNLVCICESCHHKVHHNVIHITGYVQTSMGIELQYKQNKPHLEKDEDDGTKINIK